MNRHEINPGNAEEIKKITAEIPDADASSPYEVVSRPEEQVVPSKVRNERMPVTGKNAAVVAGIVEGFENKTDKPPRFDPDAKEITPDNAIQYAIQLLNYRLSTKLESVRSAHGPKDIEAVTREVEALSRTKDEIAKGNNESAIKFLLGEDAYAILELHRAVEKVNKTGVGNSPEQRKATNKLRYYVQRSQDLERSIHALGGKTVNELAEKLSA